MRILMLTPYLPYPPSSGGQIRSYNLIKQLSVDHQITLCSLIKSDGDKKYIDKLKPFCKEVFVFKRAEKPWTLKNILKTGFSSFPFLVIRNYSDEEKKALPEIIGRGDFDIIHAETFYVSPHIPKVGIPVVLVDQTIEYDVYRHVAKNFKFPALKPMLWVDVLKIKYWESFYWKKAARVVAVSEQDAKVMKKMVPGLKVAVVPNGVGEDLSADLPSHFNKTALFMGNYAWLQNIEAARILAKEIFPLILKEVPDAKLVIAGQDTNKIAGLQSDQINLLNLSADDVEGVKRAYRESGVLIAPLYGPGGTRLKILGAMASRLPVVTTTVGISGIDAINGESVLVADKKEDIAKLAVKLFNDRKLYEKIEKNARMLVDSKYSYEAIAKKLSSVYAEVTRG